MPDPANSRPAILLGLLILALCLACCCLTLLGWTRGALHLLQ